MSDLENRRAERRSRPDAGGVRVASRYSDAVNRYLGAVGYRETVTASDAGSEAAPAATRRSTGVVLVGVDETPTSYTAVDHAAIEAELRGWDLRLLHVRHATAALYSTGEIRARLLKHMTDRVHAYSPMITVTSRIVIGAASTLLLSDAHNADLVVVGHRHSAAGTAFGLSVADRVASHHTGPVLVVRVPGWPPAPKFGTRPLVVGVDDTPASRRAVAFAMAEAGVRGCDVIMLHGTGTTDATGDHVEIVNGIRVHRRAVAGDPVTALITASDKAAAVVVGRRGPGAFAGALLGSVSRSLVQRAQCPVFLVG
jgi:nucleotide-binding universal stress UspA family protein